MSDCLSCQLLRKRDRGQAPPWDSVYRSGYWDLVHAYNTSCLGWMALVARRQ